MGRVPDLGPGLAPGFMAQQAGSGDTAEPWAVRRSGARAGTSSRVWQAGGSNRAEQLPSTTHSTRAGMT